MISASTETKTLLKTNSSIKILSGCDIEYNMNSMVELTPESITGPTYTKVNGKEAFKKLFPLDTIMNPNRPATAGIKYAISGDVSRGYTSSTTANSGDYRNPRLTTYPVSYRTYYPGLSTPYKYWVSPIGEGGTIEIIYPKDILTNKIIVSFEISHAVPPTWSLYLSGNINTPIKSGTSSDIPSFSSENNAGVLTLYYSGSSWSTDEATLNKDAYVTTNKLKLTFGEVASKYIGVIELSPRLVKDISHQIAGMDIQKESTSSDTNILPVGNVTANTLSLYLSDYNSDSMKIISYDKATSFEIDYEKTYMVKKAILTPYFSVYDLSTDTEISKIVQGKFLIDAWTTSEYGDVNLTAYDGAKILQETMCPPILCDSYSVTAIIRRLLDAIGFTNYRFNMSETDKSIITPNYWWTDETQTVWDSIQELCMDTQMTAVFDEDNILQFYTRDYMYSDNRSTSWVFSYDEYTYPDSTTQLANIMSMSKDELPSANEITILWQNATTSNYDNSSGPVWKSGSSYLAAAGLAEDLLPTDIAGSYVKLVPITTNEYDKQKSLYAFTGYFSIGGEIIEYDAMQYEYIPLLKDDGTENTDNLLKKYVDIKSESDVLKYRSLSKPSTDAFLPSGKYRIKTRGALGTENNASSTHKAGYDSVLENWVVSKVVLK